ncbi:MAG: hypothetical protein ACYTG6_00680 [Planctomycetota bacterium]|jgi:hypothetical protein
MTSTTTETDARLPAALRLLAYVVVQAVALLAYLYAMANVGADGANAFLNEGGPMEWIEVAILGLGALVLLGAFRAGEPILHRLLFLLVIMALARELDGVLEGNFFRKAHRWIMVPVAVALVAWAARRRRAVVPQVLAFLTRPAFAYFVFGALLAMLYAQFLGQTFVWRSLAEDMQESAKRFVEEGLEAAGYLWILCGVLEERVFAPPRRSIP